VANTVTVQNVIDWAKAFTRLLPNTGVGGVSNEPALTLANMVQQTLLAAPFAWRWNRTSVTFNVLNGTQDYAQAMTDLGFIEKVTISTGSAIYSMDIANVLPEETKTNRPFVVAAQKDDGITVTFRFFPVPNFNGTATVTYQKAAPKITSLSATWILPDNLAYLYETGFLAMLFLHAADQRAVAEYQKFMQLALAASQGFSADTKVFAAANPQAQDASAQK